ncbi:maleylacetate reductase [Wenxinia marina]|uniref:Maleylacetate reductase n=1 Tax=Wenxinia marina DSM 24838 TaxID=1123501 RepID=A0A0D0NM74_9RHOB|nr:maleylacetate reductase [Wenxinia marina]KIQ69400.1 maleylacetate reductase [Wenxinia marina DSM 24838]GGL58013.1 maleylacetate reductase [Wenxinia marina]
MSPFVFPGIATRVVFGHGTLARTGDEVARLGRSRALLLTTRSQAEAGAALADRMGETVVGTFGDAAMHTPVEVTDRAIRAYQGAGADCVVSLGGGSTIGLGKAIATRTGCDHVAIPTTYAGSEMTDILGETTDGEKTTRRDPSIRPETVIYDVDLTLGLPVDLSVKSALNAAAHAVEALYAPDGNPVTSLMSLEALRAIRDTLPKLREAPEDKAIRGRLLYGAWLCSTALGYVAMSLHHKLAHVVGGSFDMPHADTHAILLPHTAGFNAKGTDLLGPVAEMFGGSVGGGLWDLAQASGAPTRLADLGLSEADLDRAADIALKNRYENPRPFDREDIRRLLQAAWEGTRPAA